MKTEFDGTQTPHPNGNEYRLQRAGQKWHLVFEGQRASFNHELGALYVAGLLWEPPQRPLHAVALALKTRGRPERGAATWDAQELAVGVGEAEAVRALWRRQRELERLLEDELQPEPVKAEALAELEALTERLRQSRWLSHRGAERCTRAVALAIKAFRAGLTRAVDAQGNPDLVLRGFARHLLEHLLIPSGRAGGQVGAWLASVPPGCFTYEPPKGVRWQGGPTGELRASGQGRKAERQVASAVVGAALGLALLCAGCAGPRPLKGGQAVTTRDASGAWQETFLQGENPAQTSRQEHSSVRVRTYTLPAGSRIVDGGEESRDPKSEDRSRRGQAEVSGARCQVSGGASQPSTINSQPFFTLSAPMPVTEREETQTRTDFGAAQKDMARELGAKLSSLRGIVWVGAGLFVFGLASLVWPPLKAVIGSVTTSAALAAGGMALMVLPSLVVGHELLLLGGVGAVVGGWFLAHRHGALSASSRRQAPSSR